MCVCVCVRESWDLWLGAFCMCVTSSIMVNWKHKVFGEVCSPFVLFPWLILMICCAVLFVYYKYITIYQNCVLWSSAAYFGCQSGQTKHLNMGARSKSARDNIYEVKMFRERNKTYANMVSLMVVPLFGCLMLSTALIGLMNTLLEYKWNWSIIPHRQTCEYKTIAISVPIQKNLPKMPFIITRMDHDRRRQMDNKRSTRPLLSAHKLPILGVYTIYIYLYLYIYHTAGTFAQHVFIWKAKY